MKKQINKSEIITCVAARTGKTKKTTETILNETLQAILDALSEGNKVQFAGFGTFDVFEQAERNGHNPITGEEITIPAKKVAKFKPGILMKKTVNH